MSASGLKQTIAGRFAALTAATGPRGFLTAYFRRKKLVFSARSIAALKMRQRIVNETSDAGGASYTKAPRNHRKGPRNTIVYSTTHS